MDKFLVDVKNVYDKYGRCIIAVSEGSRIQGEPIVTKLVGREEDAHGNVQLSGTAL